MAKYNAVLNFGGNRYSSEPGDPVIVNNSFILKFELDVEDYQEGTGGPSSGTVIFHLLTGDGANITNFKSANAEDTDDGGIIINLSGGGGDN